MASYRDVVVVNERSAAKSVTISVEPSAAIEVFGLGHKFAMYVDVPSGGDSEKHVTARSSTVGMAGNPYTLWWSHKFVRSFAFDGLR